MDNILEEQKIKYFRQRILSWYKHEKRDFPWRSKDCNTYQIIIGEILLQRTRAEVVAKFFPKFINKYSSWESLGASDERDLEEFLRPIGLWHRRAIALNSLAKAVLQRGGELPDTRVGLESLPAVGQYITNAILTICHGKKEPLLDVNMARLLERFFKPRTLADIRYDPYLQDLSRKVMSCKRAKELNWAILDFAALVCKARKPVHGACSVRNKCSHYQKASNGGSN